MNSTQYSHDAVRNMQQVFPFVNPRPQRKRHLGCLGLSCRTYYV